MRTILNVWTLVVGSFLLISSHLVDGSHILFLHTCTSYSHRVSSWPFIEALLKQGHQITFIGPYTSTVAINKNVTDIIPKRLTTYVESVINSNFDVTHRAYGLTPKFVMVYDYICYEACSELLQSEEFQSWLNSSPNVDLIYTDTVAECSYGLAAKLKAKHALILPLTFMSKHFVYGIPPDSSIPDWDVAYKQPLGFMKRVVGTIVPLIWQLSQNFYYPWYQSLFSNYLALDNIPSLEESQANTSLILINGDFIEDYPRSYPPMVVKVPGFHVKALNGMGNKAVNKELESFISSQDESGNHSQGFFYISFGTVAKGPNLPLEIRKIFFSTIESFPHLRFIWRWDGPNPEKYPKNLMLKRWLNQEDLLGHPQIKGFVTQAGRLSMIEAFYNGVPTITFPILGDQDFNAHRFEELGVSIGLDIVGITGKALSGAISMLMNNSSSSHSARIKQLQRFARESRQTKPLETAVWWNEFVLRHNQEQLSLLRPLSQNMYWFQSRDLDVWIVLFILLYIILKGLFYTILLIFRKIFPKASDNVQNRKPKSS